MSTNLQSPSLTNKTTSDSGVDGQLIACAECDLLIKKDIPLENHNLLCPRCHSLLLCNKKDSVNRTLALSLAAFIFYIPANTLPIMRFELLTLDSTNTMVNGALQLFDNGFWWMSVLVLFCSIFAPLIEIILLISISSFALLKRYPPYLKRLLKWQHHISEWGMLEVYMLGIIVAYVKMLDMGTVVVGNGLYCFIALLFLTLAAASSFDPQKVWQQIEQQDKSHDEVSNDSL